MENQPRRSNLRFDNIPDTEGETWDKSSTIITDLLEKTLDLGPNIDLERVHRVGPFDPTRRRPRTIVAKFHRYRDREAAFRNAKKLKGTDVVLREDLCEASRQRRIDQWPQLRKAKEEGHRAYFNHTTLKIKP